MECPALVIVTAMSKAPEASETRKAAIRMEAAASPGHARRGKKTRAVIQDAPVKRPPEQGPSRVNESLQKDGPMKPQERPPSTLPSEEDAEDRAQRQGRRKMKGKGKAASMRQTDLSVPIRSTSQPPILVETSQSPYSGSRGTSSHGPSNATSSRSTSLPPRGRHGDMHPATSPGSAADTQTSSPSTSTTPFPVPRHVAQALPPDIQEMSDDIVADLRAYVTSELLRKRLERV